MTSVVTTPTTAPPIIEPQDGLSAILAGTDIGSAAGVGAEPSTEPQDGLGIALAASDIGKRPHSTP